MPRKTAAPQASAPTRRWRYTDETARVLTTVRLPDGSTLLAAPGGVYELHPDHDADPDFAHPLLEVTDDPAHDPSAVEPDPDAEAADTTDIDPAADEAGDNEETA